MYNHKPTHLPAEQQTSLEVVAYNGVLRTNTNQQISTANNTPIKSASPSHRRADRLLDVLADPEGILGVVIAHRDQPGAAADSKLVLCGQRVVWRCRQQITSQRDRQTAAAMRSDEDIILKPGHNTSITDVAIVLEVVAGKTC